MDNFIERSCGGREAMKLIKLQRSDHGFFEENHIKNLWLYNILINDPLSFSCLDIWLIKNHDHFFFAWRKVKEGTWSFNVFLLVV